ncbi:hypothetical protein [Thalassomonas sp. RHCl1]|uniref:hypothetical protein n=1 Tax=Thalassomonas sp. RHCl1 TaxID=2995320 RepID=UPI00248CE1EB|nr:hypothetical protein [Thalassomonas sp. RHCl1]
MELRITKKILAFEEAKLSSYVDHLASRRFGTFSLFIGIISLFLVIGQKLAWADWDILTAYSHEGLKPILLGVWATLFISSLLYRVYRYKNISTWIACLSFNAKADKILKTTSEQYKGFKKKLSKELNWLIISDFFLIIFLLLITNSENACPIIAAVTLAVFAFCYFLNKQHGFTRAWSRYEKTQDLLEVLLWEFTQVPTLYSGHNKDKRMAVLHEKYVQIIETQIHERQRDIIGDYLSTNDAAFSWVKSLKK